MSLLLPLLVAVLFGVIVVVVVPEAKLAAQTQQNTGGYSFITKWGTQGAGERQFQSPSGVAVDSQNNVYVADSGNDRIQKFSSNGTFITKWGSQGNANGQFAHPTGIATDASGNVYVADTFNNRVQKFTSNGTFITKWGTRGSGNGQFAHPTGIATDASGNVYVADTVVADTEIDFFNNRVQKFTSGGAFVTKWGRFFFPKGIATDASGKVYVGDERNRVLKFTSNGTFITKLGSPWGFGDPNGIATDASGNVYVADTFNNRVQKFTSGGAFVTKWGRRGSGNGQFFSPSGIAIDASGKVYVTDRGNHRIQKFADVVAPSVVKVVPAANARGVSPRLNVKATFSEQMNKATINKSTFKLYKAGTTKPVAAKVSYNFATRMATLNPYGASTRLLAKKTRYKAVVTTAVKDLAGNKMATQKVWYFKTRR